MRAAWPAVRKIKPPHIRRYILHIFALIFLISIIWIEVGMAHASTSFDHTKATVDSNCHQAHFSSDGNPFPLCPAPYQTARNCLSWPRSHAHLPAYSLP